MTLLRKDLVLRLLKLLLHPHLLAQIREDADGADGRFAVVDERRREQHRDPLAGRVDHVGLQPLDAAAAHAKLAHDLARLPVRIEVQGGRPEHLVGGLSVDALGRVVREQNAPLHVGTDDAVDRRVDDALEKVLRLQELRFDGALGGDVAERAEHGAFLTEDRVEVAAERDETPVFVANHDVHVLRVDPLAEAETNLVQARPLVGADDGLEGVAAELDLGVAGDLARLRVREEQAWLVVDDDDAVGGALEEVRVALEVLQALLRLEARDRDLLRLVPERLQDARVAERDGHRVRHGPAKRQLVLAERERMLGAQEEHAHRAPLVDDGEDRERAERQMRRVVTDDLEDRVGRDVGDDEGLAAAEHLLNLGVLRQHDGEIAQRLVVRRRHDVAHVPRLAHEHDRHAVDLRDLRDALRHREENPSEIQVRRERLRQLEDNGRVLLLLRQLVHDAAQTKLATEARHELDGLEGLAHEVVRPRFEGARDLVVGVEPRHDDDRHIARLLARPQDTEHLVAVGRRHHEVEQDQRGLKLVELRDGVGARRHRYMGQVGARERLDEDVPADRIVVYDQNGAVDHPAGSVSAGPGCEQCPRSRLRISLPGRHRSRRFAACA